MKNENTIANTTSDDTILLMILSSKGYTISVPFLNKSFPVMYLIHY